MPCLPGCEGAAYALVKGARATGQDIPVAAVWRFAEDLRQRDIVATTDPALEVIHLSKCFRSSDQTSASMATFMNERFGAAELTDARLAQALLEVVVLRRLGVMAPVLKHLATAPADLESFVSYVVEKSIVRWRAGKHSFTNAVFTSKEAHMLEVHGWRDVDLNRGNDSKVREVLGSLRESLTSLAMGTSDVEGVVALAQDNVGQAAICKHLAHSFQRSVETLSAVPGFGDFTAQEAILDMYMGLQIVPPPDFDTYSVIGPGVVELLQELRMPTQRRKVGTTGLSRLTAVCQSQQGSCWTGPPVSPCQLAFILCEMRKYLNWYEGRPVRLRTVVISQREAGREFALTSQSQARILQHLAVRGVQASGKKNNVVEMLRSRLLAESDSFPWFVEGRQASATVSWGKYYATECCIRENCPRCGEVGLSYGSTKAANDREPRKCTQCGKRSRPKRKDMEEVVGEHGERKHTKDTSRALRQIAAAQDIWDKVSKGRFSASWATSPTTDVSMALAALAFDLEGGCQTFDAGDQSWFTPIASKVLAPGKEARRIMALMLMALGGADDVASVALCA
mmetsp:Transcript_66330/g.190676  ORF Transcript_66330/g.190676 Transcript_66330/m.190676 type:complete len:568 (-) Transcript_66330:76-1779(-)